jgi:dihydroorotate dehydrogenase
LYKELSNFGFGFIEIGTLTKGQDGNPKKRFRLKEDSAIINRMGFNNGGVLEAVERLKKNTVLIGGTLVKQTDVKRRCHFGL